MCTDIIHVTICHWGHIMKKYLILIVLFLLLGCQKTDVQPTFTMETYPKVDGSTVTIPLSEAICAKLTGQTVEQVRPYILHTKTHSAYINLIEKKTDLIFVTYQIGRAHV